jgi:hypothetical protein
MQPEIDPEMDSPSANYHAEHDDIQSFAGFKEECCRPIRIICVLELKWPVHWAPFQG